MESNTGLVAGSHNRQQLFVIRPDVDQVRMQSNPAVCQICGDPTGLDVEGKVFVACGECAFPVCRGCYEDERRQGSQNCFKCKKRYKRLKGSPRVPGDDDEDDADDFENEFRDLAVNRAQQQTAAAHSPSQLGQTSPGYENQYPEYADNYPRPQYSFPLLTDGAISETSSMIGGPEENNRAIALQQVAPVNDMNGHRPVQPVSYNLRPEPQPLPVRVARQYSGPPLGASGQEQVVFGHGSIVYRPPGAYKEKASEDMEMVTMENNGTLTGVPGGPEGPKGPHHMSPEPDSFRADEARQPLSRKVPIRSGQINPYRLVIVARLVILGFFLRYRVLNPVPGAYGLWLTSVICEFWFAVSWILDQFPKWLPINRDTYIDRLAKRFESNGESKLAPVDVFVSTVDPLKEPVLSTANTLLSILSMDYPAEKLSCYLSDDGAAFLSFESLIETAEFARRWVPFAKRYNIEPRAPDMYFREKADYLKGQVDPFFVRDRRTAKKEYEQFKVRINALVKKYEKAPEDGWMMPDGTPWPGNNSRDHPGMIQVFLGPNGGLDVDGNPLPRLVYASREKRPGYNHHKKAGAMNAMVRVSAILTNAPYVLNLDCDHYVNNSKALREAMCFMMDPHVGPKTCYVQFPQRFDGIDRNDRYANHNTVFFDINMRGLDGVQGPVYVGTGCCFRRHALYGYDAPLDKEKEEKKKKRSCMRTFCCCLCCCGRKAKKHSDDESKKRLTDADVNVNVNDMEAGDKSEERVMNQYQKIFGPSAMFILSTFHEKEAENEAPSNPESTLKEAIHVISCGYELKSDWGKELGWIYGSVTEDILTGFKMHTRGWRSIYCMPKRPAFKGSAPINLTDRLQQVLRWALGSVEIFLSRHCPIWYGYREGGRLKWLQRLAYINTVVYPWTSFPLVAYCVLPAICLITNKFIIPAITTTASLFFICLFISIFATAALEIRWSKVSLEEWWRNEQFWVIGGVSSHLFAVFQGLLKVLAGIDTNFTVTSKQADDEGEFAELYLFKWTSLLIVPTTLIIINLIGIVAGIANAVNNGFTAWGPLFGKLFFSFWVVVHLYPFLKGLMGRNQRTPTIIIVWSILLASIFSLIWVNINPFTAGRGDGPQLTKCGINC